MAVSGNGLMKFLLFCRSRPSTGHRNDLLIVPKAEQKNAPVPIRRRQTDEGAGLSSPSEASLPTHVRLIAVAIDRHFFVFRGGRKSARPVIIRIVDSSMSAESVVIDFQQRLPPHDRRSFQVQRRVHRECLSGHVFADMATVAGCG